ncbi:hypothetical protein MLD38_031824 [Melastoma candidum]|uniref:Uncharacterized protein n=1 Tax=Melastoma candidum TaxID=119954 RepID=A0ACB9MQ88_9MYRT|nr:hypothetical protein MLD38_031824 [Melastoma candidum]
MDLSIMPHQPLAPVTSSLCRTVVKFCLWTVIRNLLQQRAPKVAFMGNFEDTCWRESKIRSRLPMSLILTTPSNQQPIQMDIVMKPHPINRAGSPFHRISKFWTLRTAALSPADGAMT